MIPGETYIQRLPGSSRLAFVRKRPVVVDEQPIVFEAPECSLSTSTKVYIAKKSSKMPKWRRPFCGSSYESYGPLRNVAFVVKSRSTSPLGASAAPIATVIQQTCSGCGKFRSPKWSASHPLQLGEAPRSNLCRKCAKKSTLSEEQESSYERREKRQRRHHHRRSTDSLDEFSREELRRLRRNYRSDSVNYMRPSRLAGSRSASADRINITIKNETNKSKPRVRTISSSDESIRVRTRASYDRTPIRRSSSSSEEEIVRDYLPRRRSLSHARYAI